MQPTLGERKWVRRPLAKRRKGNVRRKDPLAWGIQAQGKFLNILPGERADI